MINFSTNEYLLLLFKIFLFHISLGYLILLEPYEGEMMYSKYVSLRIKKYNETWTIKDLFYLNLLLPRNLYVLFLVYL